MVVSKLIWDYYIITVIIYAYRKTDTTAVDENQDRPTGYRHRHIPTIKATPSCHTTACDCSHTLPSSVTHRSICPASRAFMTTSSTVAHLIATWSVFMDLSNPPFRVWSLRINVRSSRTRGWHGYQEERTQPCMKVAVMMSSHANDADPLFGILLRFYPAEGPL